MTDADTRLALLDVHKFARFSSSTLRADKYYKTIGYGIDVMGHLMAHTAQQETDTSKGFKAMASNILMARYVIRFTGGFESYAAWKNGSWCHSDDSDHVKRIVRLQALSMLVYYPLEHISYIGFVAPKLLDIDAMKISRQSCQAWGIYILLDMYATMLRIFALIGKKKQLKAQMDPSDDELATIETRCRELYYVQLRNFFLAGPCLHWSLEKGFLPAFGELLLRRGSCCRSMALVGEHEVVTVRTIMVHVRVTLKVTPKLLRRRPKATERYALRILLSFLCLAMINIVWY